MWNKQSGKFVYLPMQANVGMIILNLNINPKTLIHYGR